MSTNPSWTVQNPNTGEFVGSFATEREALEYARRHGWPPSAVHRNPAN